MENLLNKNAVLDNDLENEEVSKLDRIDTNKVNIIINEDEFVIPYGIKYKMVVKQPDDALSKMYDEKNEMIVNLRVPANEYNDEDLQELIKWSTLSNLDKGYFRNLAIYMRMNEKFERAVVFTHAYIRMNKKVNTKADYVDIELIVNQRGDKFVGVGFGHSLEDTLRKTKERVENPPRVNVIVPIVNNKKVEGLLSEDVLYGDEEEKIIVYYFSNSNNYEELLGKLIKGKTSVTRYNLHKINKNIYENASVSTFEYLGDVFEDMLFISKGGIEHPKGDGKKLDYLKELANSKGLISLNEGSRNICLVGDVTVPTYVNLWWNGTLYEKAGEVIDGSAVIYKEIANKVAPPNTIVGMHLEDKKLREMTDHDISWWYEDDGTFSASVNTSMNKSSVRLIREGSNIYITLRVKFGGNAKNKTYPSSTKTYKELVIEGFKEWEGTYYNRTDSVTGIVYDNFGKIGNVTVTIDIVEKTSNVFDIKLIEFLNDINTRQVCHVNRPSNWTIGTTDDMIMSMYWGYSSGDGKGTLKTYIDRNFLDTAKHELGHILGIGDAYGGGSRPEAADTDEVPRDAFYAGATMRQNGPVLSNDIEMVLEAFKKNTWQYFQDYDGNTRSEVIRLG